jgi:hypothetical protein
MDATTGAVEFASVEVPAPRPSMARHESIAFIAYRGKLMWADTFSAARSHRFQSAALPNIFETTVGLTVFRPIRIAPPGPAK